MAKKERHSQAEWETRQHRRERVWRSHVAAWQASGGSQADYCRTRKLAPADFSWWKHKLLRRDRLRKGRDGNEGAPDKTALQDAHPFLPVALVSTANPLSPNECELLFRSGRRLRIGAAVSAERIGEVAAAIEKLPPC